MVDTPADRAGSLPVAIVNQAFVRRYLPGADPIGRRVRLDAGLVELIACLVRRSGPRSSTRWWPFERSNPHVGQLYPHGP